MKLFYFYNENILRPIFGEIPKSPLVDWQESVIDRFDPTVATPAGPTTGDRYLATATANGWTANNIYEWNAVAWVETAANEGMATWVEDENLFYVYNGTNWIVLGTLVAHNNLTGLQGGVATEYYHLTSAQHTALTAGFTGTGSLVRATSPSLVTPALGAATATSVNIGGTFAIVGAIDDDTMATATATNIASAESIKAYSDNKSADLQIHGFADNTETSIGFNDSTYVFTLTDAGAGWSYYRNGVKYTISGNKTTTLAGSPPSADTYYIYIDAIDGTLSNSTTPWDFTDGKVFVAVIQWDNTLTPKYILADERHTSVMVKGVHHYNHDTFGTRLGSSGAISGYVINSDVDANKQFDIAESEIWDEDLEHTLSAITGGVDNYHIAYRTGAATWVWKQTAMPFDYTVAGYINYDNAGTMTQGQNNKFYTTYLMATNHSGLARYVVIHGQSEFSSLIEARAEQFTDLTLTNLGVYEGIAIWKFIWESSSSYTSTGKCRLAVNPIPINTNVVTATAPPGLGTMSTQDADNVAITGGTVTGLTTLGVTGLAISNDSTNIYTEITSGSSVTNHVGPVSLADDASFDLPDASAGWGHFMVGDGEEFAQIMWKTTGVVQLITSTANVDDADTDGYFCIFDNGTSVRVRNRLGSAKTVTFNYEYTTTP